MRVGLIGCGTQARDAHGPAMRKCSRAISNTILSACGDPDPSRAERFAREFGFDRHYGDLDQMLEREKLDALMLVAPPGASCDLACRILNKRIPLLMEKQPDLSLEDLDLILATADRYGVPVMAAVNHHFMPLMGSLKRRLAAEPEGSIQHIDYECVRVSQEDGSFSTSVFRGVDAMRLIAGADYAALRFTFRPVSNEPGAANVFLDGAMTNGITVGLRFVPISGADLERACVYTEEHLYRLHMPVANGMDGAGRLLSLEQGSVREERQGPPAAAGNLFESAGYFGEIVAFLDALSKGRMPEPGLAGVRQSVEVAACIQTKQADYRAT